MHNGSIAALVPHVGSTALTMHSILLGHILLAVAPSGVQYCPAGPCIAFASPFNSTTANSVQVET